MYEQINEGCAPFCFMFFSFQIQSFSASVFSDITGLPYEKPLCSPLLFTVAVALCVGRRCSPPPWGGTPACRCSCAPPSPAWTAAAAAPGALWAWTPGCGPPGPRSPGSPSADSEPPTGSGGRDRRRGRRWGWTEGEKGQNVAFNCTIKGPLHSFIHSNSVCACVYVLVRPRRDGGVLERYDVCGRNQSAGVQLQGDRFYRGGAGVRLPVCPPWVIWFDACFQHGRRLRRHHLHHHHHHHRHRNGSLRKKKKEVLFFVLYIFSV